MKDPKALPMDDDRATLDEVSVPGFGSAPFRKERAKDEVISKELILRGNASSRYNLRFAPAIVCRRARAGLRHRLCNDSTGERMLPFHAR